MGKISDLTPECYASCGNLRPRPGQAGSVAARAATAVAALSDGFVVNVRVAAVGGYLGGDLYNNGAG